MQRSGENIFKVLLETDFIYKFMMLIFNVVLLVSIFRSITIPFTVFKSSKPSKKGKEAEDSSSLAAELMYEAGIVSPLLRSDRPKNIDSALKRLTEEDGFVLLMVDPDKCGYCDRAKLMLEVRGLPYREVNITDLPLSEAEKLADKLGVTGVPVLFYVKGGEIKAKIEFTGKRETDAIMMRGIERILEKKLKAGEGKQVVQQEQVASK